MGDIDLALSRVTIADILSDAGIELGSHNRIACPLHRGNNRSAFSYTDIGFRCFDCQEQGSHLDLIQKLHGMSRPNAIRHLYRLAGLPYTEPDESEEIGLAPRPPESSTAGSSEQVSAGFSKRDWEQELEKLGIARDSGDYRDYEKAKRLVSGFDLNGSEDYERLIRWTCDYVRI